MAVEENCSNVSPCARQVIDMPEHNPGQMGGTMRLGKRRTIFKNDNSVLSEYPWSPSGELVTSQEASVQLFLFVLFFFFTEKLYGDVEYVDERHRHRFEVETKQGFNVLNQWLKSLNHF